MAENNKSLESKLSEKLSKESINSHIMAILLRGDSPAKLAGALYISTTILNEAMDMLRELNKRFNNEGQNTKFLEYFIEVTEQHRRRGKKILESAKAGHVAVHGTQEARITRNKEILNSCIKISNKNENWGLTAIRQQVSEEFELSLKTVQRATPNLKELLGRN